VSKKYLTIFTGSITRGGPYTPFESMQQVLIIQVNSETRHQIDISLFLVTQSTPNTAVLKKALW